MKQKIAGAAAGILFYLVIPAILGAIKPDMAKPLGVWLIASSVVIGLLFLAWGFLPGFGPRFVELYGTADLPKLGATTAPAVGEGYFRSGVRQEIGDKSPEYFVSIRVPGALVAAVPEGGTAPIWRKSLTDVGYIPPMGIGGGGHGVGFYLKANNPRRFSRSRVKFHVTLRAANGQTFTTKVAPGWINLDQMDATF